MPPDLASSLHRSESLRAHEPHSAWRSALLLMLSGALVVMTVTAREWAEMFHQWLWIDTFSHILLVPPVIAWLVHLKRDDLAQITPAPWAAGLGIVAVGLALWLAGRASGINLLAHAGAVGALQGVVLTAIGPRAGLALALPIGFAVFLVPFGDEIIGPLQIVTAKIAVTLTIWSGIPAEIDGIFIQTPIGLFIVAEACSGVKFLIAMIALAVLVCFTRFASWRRRAAFIALAIIVPIIANGLRAWGTIYIAQSRGTEFAAGLDHIVYGWVFFAIVVAVVLAAAWRFFERDPDAYGWDASEIGAMAWPAALESRPITPATALAAILTLVLVAMATLAIAVPKGMG
ncbi:exosortase A [Qipengyuania nanhaisediminis]|uniref:exosortase A n=1 Tax=Qipengyuania nanhaisediminis TaxID=604088 RepID=UPI0038B2E986